MSHPNEILNVKATEKYFPVLLFINRNKMNFVLIFVRDKIDKA